MKYSLLVPLALIAAGIANPAVAQEKPIALSSDVKLVRIVEADGQKQEQLVPASSVVPGDKLVFTTNYRNASGEAVTDFTVVSPVPQHMTLADQDLSNAQTSIDGGKTYARLTELQVVDSTTGERRPAQPSDVTHLRWTLASVAPGAEGSVKFSAVVR